MFISKIICEKLFKNYLNKISYSDFLKENYIQCESTLLTVTEKEVPLLKNRWRPSGHNNLCLISSPVHKELSNTGVINYDA
jgi:hypothetical protein